MNPELLGIIVNSGAVGLLSVVIWQVSVKLDTMMQMNEKLVNRLIDLIDTSKAQIQAMEKTLNTKQDK